LDRSDEEALSQKSPPVIPEALASPMPVFRGFFDFNEGLQAFVARAQRKARTSAGIEKECFVS
jgi:hypothetical protein